MDTGPAVEDRVFNEVKRLCYAGLDATTLRREVVETLKHIVPFEAYCCFTADPSSGLPIDVMSEVMNEADVRFFLEHIYFEYDMNSPQYREFVRQQGLEYELHSVLTVGRVVWGGLELGRERGRPDFEPRDFAFLRRIAPHLGAGLKAAALRAQASAEQDGDAVPGFLTLDDRGRVVQHTRAAKRWLQELGDVGPGWREGAGLPAAVWAVEGALRRALKTCTCTSFAAVRSIRCSWKSGSRTRRT